MSEIKVSTDPGIGPRILVAAGLIAIVLAAFMTPLVIRSICIAAHYDEYTPDTFHVEYYSEQGDTSFGGYVVSSGERYADDNANLVGDLEFVRKLDREKKLQDYLAPILYIPRSQGLWKMVDFFNRFRIIRPDEIKLSGMVELSLVVGAFWICGIASLRKGIRDVKKRDSNS